MMKSNVHTFPHLIRTLARGAAVPLLLALSACAGVPPSLPRAGAQASEIAAASAIELINVDAALVQQLQAGQQSGQLAALAAPGAGLPLRLGAGDVIEVSLWEAAPAALFGLAGSDPRAAGSASKATVLPEQMIAADGTITVPFAGAIAAAGGSTAELERAIVARLRGRANQPQALVRVIRNNSANVTVVGEVNASTRMPLTARGERVLDALAAAGGVRQPVAKTSVQIARRQQVQAMPLEAVIRDPRQNIVLEPGDVLTAMFQPYSFTVLGAANKNEEVAFEGRGISLVQALGRAGGLQDSRADVSGVFVFRLDTAGGRAPHPVVYRLDLKDPAAFFAAQNFPVQDKDVLYVSNAPAADLQKFLSIVVQAIYPVANIVNLSK